ncbi:hypothetical protein G4B88_000886 [Cannabis sativa]|uniref:Uncharacterized protein n=1 Tax=Cannabis sativa TaxID=3483 RepID=A0A7J6ENB2_CANSA|nr:hypothetical protein G4B88_000886 [Cannabis sativa]
MVFSSVCSFPSSLGTNFKLVPRSNFKASSSHYHEINNFINNKPIKFSYFSSRLYCSAKPIVYRENKFTKSFSLSHLQRKSSIKAHGEIEADGSDGTSEFNVMKSGNAIWRFVRPYAAKGVLFNSAGINQIYDLDIDRLNKPNLPVASGEISVELAWLLTISSFFLHTFLCMTLGFEWHFEASIILKCHLFILDHDECEALYNSTDCECDEEDEIIEADLVLGVAKKFNNIFKMSPKKFFSNI